MTPEVSLHFAAIFLNFFVRVALVFLACWLVNRLLSKPRQRFAVWMMFLLGTGFYWLGLIFTQWSALSAVKTGLDTVSGRGHGVCCGSVSDDRLHGRETCAVEAASAARC